jgi:hypothetical protein
MRQARDLHDNTYYHYLCANCQRFSRHQRHGRVERTRGFSFPDIAAMTCQKQARDERLPAQASEKTASARLAWLSEEAHAEVQAGAS